MDELGIDSFSFSDMLLFREVCMVVSRRSANLAAAAIACVLNRVKKPSMTVAIDGSTYKYHPFFDHWVTEKIKELINPGLEFKVVQTGDGSGKGAALIAAIVSRVKQREEKKRRDAEDEMKRKLKEEEAKLQREREERLKDKEAEDERARKREEQLHYEEERRTAELVTRENLLEED